MGTAATVEAISAWPVEDQLELLFELSDRIGAGGVPPVTPELAAELDRRRAAHAADPSRARTWEQVEAHVRWCPGERGT